MEEQPDRRSYVDRLPATIVPSNDTTYAAPRSALSAFCWQTASKDGIVFPGEILTTIFMDRDGLDRTSMIIRDVSKRKRAEQEREAALRRYRIAPPYKIHNCLLHYRHRTYAKGHGERASSPTR